MILERHVCREQSPCPPLQRGLEAYTLPGTQEHRAFSDGATRNSKAILKALKAIKLPLAI